MNKFSKLITVVAFAIFVLSTSLFAQEKTSKVADAEMKAALEMSEYRDVLNIPHKGVVNREVIIVRDKINKKNKKNKKNIIRAETIAPEKKEDFWGLYFPMRYYPYK